MNKEIPNCKDMKCRKCGVCSIEYGGTIIQLDKPKESKINNIFIFRENKIFIFNKKDEVYSNVITKKEVIDLYNYIMYNSGEIKISNLQIKKGEKKWVNIQNLKNN